MAWLRQRWVPLTVLVAATIALVASVVWAAVGLPGTGKVRSLDDASRAASRFGGRWDLHAGEVMQFDNGFYAELLDHAGNRPVCQGELRPTARSKSVWQGEFRIEKR